MKNKKNEKYPDDDGRVIAPMNVDGMPWYVPKVESPGDAAASAAVNTDTVYSPSSDTAPEPVQMTRAETLAFTWGVLKASLLVVLVFAGALFAFIMFCIHVWFR